MNSLVNKHVFACSQEGQLIIMMLSGSDPILKIKYSKFSKLAPLIFNRHAVESSASIIYS